MSSKKSRGYHHDDDDLCEPVMPSRGLTIRHNREMCVADNKYPSTRAYVCGSTPFFVPRTVSSDSLLYSGEVPINLLPPTLPFPPEAVATNDDIDFISNRSDKKNGDRKEWNSSDKDEQCGGEGKFEEEDEKHARPLSPSSRSRATRK